MSGTGAARLNEAAAAHAAGRMEEAAALLARLDAGEARSPAALELGAALCMAGGDAAGAVAALRAAAARTMALLRLVDPRQQINLGLACLAAGDGSGAIAARAAAVAAIARRRDAGERAPPGERAQLAELERLLSAALWGAGLHDAAIAALVRAAELAEDEIAQPRLTGMLLWRGRLGEALVAGLAQALAAPESAEAARGVAQVAGALGAAEAARAWWRRVLALVPGDAAAAAELEKPAAADMPADAAVARLVRPAMGLASAPADAIWPAALARGFLAARGAAEGELRALLRLAAVAALRRALALRPGQAEQAAELARLLAEGGGEEAGGESGAAMLRAALKLAPGDAALHQRLGQVLHEAGDYAAAEASLRTALELRPDFPQAMVGLVAALLAQGPSAEAMALLDRAEVLDPDMPRGPAWSLRAHGLMLAGRHGEAAAVLRRLLEQWPDDANARFGLGLTLLALGEFEEGWPLYAWRWLRYRSASAGRAPAEPLVRPDPASWRGRTVLLYSEQGQGDVIHFLRYARMVAAEGARVLLEVPTSLKVLAGSIPDLAGVYAAGEDVPAYDDAVPLLHLPWAFGTTLASVPAAVPYLRPDLTRAAGFRRRLAGLPGLKVGLVWSGDPRAHSSTQSSMDRRRSVTLAALAPLAAVPGVVFVSVQKGGAAAQARTPPSGMILHDWTAELEDFAATAALMAALDLVISVDSAPVHLAGALGRPVWLLNRFDSDFRWVPEVGGVCPWYPTLRQFRQEAPGDWDGVIARVAAALREKAG